MTKCNMFNCENGNSVVVGDTDDVTTTTTTTTAAKTATIANRPAVVVAGSSSNSNRSSSATTAPIVTKNNKKMVISSGSTIAGVTNTTNTTSTISAGLKTTSTSCSAQDVVSSRVNLDRSDVGLHQEEDEASNSLKRIESGQIELSNHQPTPSRDSPLSAGVEPINQNNNMHGSKLNSIPNSAAVLFPVANIQQLQNHHITDNRVGTFNHHYLNSVSQEDRSDIGMKDDTYSSMTSRMVDSGSQGSSTSSNPFVDPPSLADVADDLSELSDLELNFDGPIEWPEGDLISTHPELAHQAIRSGAPIQLDTATKLLLYQGDKADLKSVDPRTQARLEALLEAAGIGKLSTTDGKAFADPEVLRKLTSSVSCALDEAAASLTRMRAENQANDLHANRTLADACSEGDIEAVKRLLNEGRSVHETNEDGESLLSLACCAGYYELAEVLLRMKANVEDRGRKGDCTPLMEAASSGYADITQLLISYEADVNAQSSAGHTALHHAAVGGYEDVVQMLIGAGANVEQQNENGHTPLMESASAGHVGVAKILLDAGAGINTHSNEFKESALTLACYKGHLDMVKFLLDAGADQEHKTDEMHTALMEASMDGHVEVARLLLDSGAQVNMPIDSFESPLTLAACGGHVELASLLLERGAKMEEVNDEGYTALMEASREGHEEMVSLLLTHGALVNTQTDETQETALTLACCGGFMEVASALISNKADIELGCSTPLMEASQEGHLELVNFLITQGSDVHALTATSDTALTYACENGHTDVAEVLLNAGAKLENESEGGRTPLMKAARAGHLCTVQFLISKGADVNRSTTNNEHTVLSLACAGGHLAVVEQLLELGAEPLHKLKDGSTMLIEAAKGGHTNVVNLLLDYPNAATHKPMMPVNEFHDSISMADGLPPDITNSANDLSLKSTETLANRLELFIRKMMSQADNSSGTREEQMARKQEILDELQRVEQELKFRTQIAQQEVSQRSPAGSPRSGLASESPPSLSPSHELVEQELQQKQMAIAKQQRHEEQLQQQKEYYQAKLQHLKQQYHEKQLQLQQQRQQLLSQAASSSSTEAPPPPPTEEEPAKRQPIPLHIALQNHLHAHHVTEGNVNDLAQALQEWDTRDRNINLPHSLIKPMPTFNLTARPDDSAIMEPPGPELSLNVEDDLTITESPPSRSLAHSLATFIQGMDTNKSEAFDPTLEKAIESSSSLERPSSEYEMTYKTLEWLKMVDEQCGADEAIEPLNMNLKPLMASKAVPKKINETQEKLANTAKITKVLNGCVDPPSVAVRPAPAVPHPQRSASPQTRPFVDPNAATDSNHDTALTLACAGGHAELVKLLLSRHAEIEHRDKKGFTPLILASTAGHSEVVEILIESGADIEAQSERTKDTPLSLACSGGRYEVVEILLRLGANKEHRNVSDYTPLSLAASGGYVNIIKLLLSYAAEINSRTGSKLGISPLMLAAMNGHTAAVKLLLDMGSDINAQIETNRNTALTLACFQGRHDVVSLLVDRKANIEHRAKTGLTPLMEAASGGYVEVGRVLLDKSADVNAPPVPSSKDTALTIAADKGHYRFVDLLLKRGAAVDVKNKKGNSPLWLACNGGHLDVVQLLVANKADIDSQDNRRVSSLMTAFRKGHVKVVKWLVRHVTQYPSDQECGRYIATVNDKELLKKCQQCMSLIVQAKEQQAREALKNASILLEQIESEKSREERRKEAAARKREKKKQKRKEKQAESQTDKILPEPEVIKPERSPTPDSPLSISPPPPVSVPVVVIEASKDAKQADRKRSNGNTVNNRARQQDSDGNEVSRSDLQDSGKSNGLGKENVSAKQNRRNKEKATRRNDSQNKKASSKESAKHPLSTGRITELDDFGDAPAALNSSTKGRNSKRLASSVSQLDSFDCIYPVRSPNKSTPSKMGVSPSPGKKKREDASDWKQVTNKKTKRLSVPARCVSHVSKALHAIKEKSGAHLELEKSEKKSADRVVVIRGSTDALRSAQALVSTLLKEPEGELSRDSNRKSNAGSVTSSNSATVPGSSRDTMSNVGMFKISDYMSSAQATATTDAKLKVVQSKPGWSVRPSPPVSQSAWGLPTGDHQPTSTNLHTSATSIPPLRMPFSQSPVPKQPTDVSRQLFPDGRSSVSPSSVNSDTKLRQPVAAMEKVESHPVASHSPGVGQLAATQPAANLPVTSPAGPAYATSPLSMAVGSKVHSTSGPPPVHANPFFAQPFDGQPPVGVKLPMGYSMPLSDGSIRHISHPNRAPGYRSDSSNFSKAPGARTVSAFSSEPMPLAVNAPLPRLGVMEVNQLMAPGAMAPGGSMSFGEPGKVSLFMRQHYSSPNSPMTLAQPPSTLNPNASEFTVHNRFGNGAQHSPRSMAQQQPRASPIEMKANTPSYQVPGMSAEQESPARPFLPGGQLSHGVPTSANNMPAIHHSPHDMAFSTSSQSTGSHNQLTSSPPSVDLLKPLAPIGVERAEQVSTTYMFSHDDIWRNKPNDEWGVGGPAGPSSVSAAISEPSMQNLFQGDASLGNMGPSHFAGFYPGGAGDGLHNTWNGSPSKIKGSQGWPSANSTWDQPNQQ